MQLRLDLLENDAIAVQNLLDVRLQLARLRIDDLVLLFDPDRE